MTAWLPGRHFDPWQPGRQRQERPAALPPPQTQPGVASHLQPCLAALHLNLAAHWDQGCVPACGFSTGLWRTGIGGSERLPTGALGVEVGLKRVQEQLKRGFAGLLAFLLFTL